MTKSTEQFRKDMALARSYVAAELRKQGLDIDVRLLTTISVMQTTALKFIDRDIDEQEARKSFDHAITTYRSDSVPF